MRPLQQIERERQQAEHQRQCDRFAPFAMAALLRGTATRRARLAAAHPPQGDEDDTVDFPEPAPEGGEA